MFRRLLQALRLIIGKPILLTVGEETWHYDPREGHLCTGQFSWTGETEMMPAARVRTRDHTYVPPLDLVFGGLVEYDSPVKVVTNGKFRVCVFRQSRTCPCCDVSVHWLVLDLEGENGEWGNLVTLHEMNLSAMRAALEEVTCFIEMENRKALGLD